MKSCCVLQDHYDDERDKTVLVLHNTTSDLKSCCVLQDHYDDERDKTVLVLHNTTSDLQDQDQDRFFGLRPVLS